MYTITYTEYHHGITGDPEIKLERLDLNTINNIQTLLLNMNIPGNFTSRHLVAFETEEERQEFIDNCEDLVKRNQRVCQPFN